MGGTDMNGNVCFEGLANGTYYLCEMCPPTGYQPNKDVTTVTLTTFENQVFLEIANTPCTPSAQGSISVTARMNDTLMPVRAVTMSLTNASMGTVATATTDANGMLKFTGLPYATYYVNVTEQPMGITTPEPVQVTVSPDAPNPDITMYFAQLVSPVMLRR